MSWARNEWKDGLSYRAIQEVEKLETQMDRFKKECQMKQCRLDTIEQAMENQKRKVDEERSQKGAIQRENQTLMDTCEELNKKLNKLQHELSNKETFISSLQGQLNQSKTQLDNEISKASKLQADFDRIQTEFKDVERRHDKLNSDNGHLRRMGQAHMSRGQGGSSSESECENNYQVVLDLKNAMKQMQTEKERDSQIKQTLEQELKNLQDKVSSVNDVKLSSNKIIHGTQTMSLQRGQRETMQEQDHFSLGDSYSKHNNNRSSNRSTCPFATYDPSPPPFFGNQSCVPMSQTQPNISDNQRMLTTATRTAVEEDNYTKHLSSAKSAVPQPSSENSKVVEQLKKKKVPTATLR